MNNLPIRGQRIKLKKPMAFTDDFEVVYSIGKDELVLDNGKEKQTIKLTGGVQTVDLRDEGGQDNGN